MSDWSVVLGYRAPVSPAGYFAGWRIDELDIISPALRLDVVGNRSCIRYAPGVAKVTRFLVARG